VHARFSFFNQLISNEKKLEDSDGNSRSNTRRGIAAGMCCHFLPDSFFRDGKFIVPG